MRLTKIKLSGFKSFVDPTTVTFPSNLTGVIGPNGCGKSNIIDAVRWVLGESSAKMLRGESMTDVIFNGSSERKPVGLASVDLVFDNSDGKVGGEYAGFSEISIRREVNREAQSTYFLNNTRCRRKDIHDAFYGTGLGSRSYSVIEQGMISRFIEAKPEELRNYLEEVAGISKYKARRRETETRIRHTRENLARLTDIREELDKQLNSLQRQAQAAERYKVLKDEERLMKGQLCVLNWRATNDALQAIQSTLSEKINQQEAKQAELRSIDTEHESKRQQQITQTDAFNAVQQQFYMIGNEVTRIEQAIAHQKERRQQLLDDQAQLSKDYQSTQDHLAEDQDQIQALQSELDMLTPKVSEAKAAYEAAREELSTAEAGMHDWQEKWDAFNEKAALITQATKVEKIKMTETEHRIDQLRGRESHIHAQLEQIQLSVMEEGVTQLRSAVATAASDNMQAKERLNALVSQLDIQKNTANQLANTLNQSQEVHHEKSVRLATLKAMQQSALNQNNEHFNRWLDQHDLTNKPRLLQTLTVEPGWELAVEAVLGSYFEAICIEDVDQIANQLTTLEEGSLLVFEKISEATQPIKPESLASKVKSEWPVHTVLGSVLLANNLMEALKMRVSLAANESIVTKEGIWLGSDWLRFAKGSVDETNLIEQKAEISSLTVSLEALAAEITALKSDLTNAKEAVQSLDQAHAAQQKTALEASIRLADMQSDLKAKQAHFEQSQAQRTSLHAELEKTQADLDLAEQALSVAQQTYEEAVTVSEKDACTRENLAAQREQLRQTLQAAQHAVRHLGEAAHETDVRAQTCKSQLDTLKQNVERLSVRLEDLTERQAQLALALETQDNPEQDLEQTLQQKLSEHRNIETEMNEKRSSMEQTTADMTALEHSRVTIEEAIAAARDAVEKIKLDTQTHKVRGQTYLEQLQEMQFELEALNETLAEDATAKIWQEEIGRVESRISRLGAINLAAADEFKAQSERKAYLDAQNEDLEKALAILEEAIAKIDKETRERFKHTYDTVNNTFQEIFPKVFGGGSAYLELLGNDLLDTGVAVFARPPGKKNSTIHLLSGGEKALVAISLVFSIFQLNPAPFCLLDEVDAPLDDANLLRYCALVKEMSQKVQFIFVTHNKIAMEMADHLMGVTMHEPGVSRLVAVDVEQAVEMAE